MENEQTERRNPLNCQDHYQLKWSIILSPCVMYPARVPQMDMNGGIHNCWSPTVKAMFNKF